MNNLEKLKFRNFRYFYYTFERNHGVQARSRHSNQGHV